MKIMRSTTFTFIIVLLLTSVVSVSAWSQPGMKGTGTLMTIVTLNIAKINPLDGDFPGGRGPDEMVVYTPEYRQATTGTNGWGIEAIVQDSMIVYIGGNNSLIPKDGLVLSAHGIAKDSLLMNAKVGTKVNVLNKQLILINDAESSIRVIELKETRVRNLYERVCKQAMDIDKTGIEKCLQQALGTVYAAKSLFSVAGKNRVLQSMLYADQLLDEALFRCSSSPTVEGRGAWHRPVETTVDAVRRTVRRFADAGFNTLFVETFWNGETIYPSDLTKQKKRFDGFDPLKIFIDEGEKNGLEIHAWIHTFFVGYVGDREPKDIGPILRAHPEWALIKHNGDSVSVAEKGYRYVCPARPDARDFIAAIYKEIKTKYPNIAGLQLDYIRYPVNMSLEESSCYCEYCRKEFKDFSGKDPLNIDPQTNPSDWDTWCKWRENQITTFVERVANENRGSIISAAVFPEVDEAIKTKMQNWKDWIDRSYLDVVSPMAYSTDASWVVASTETVAKTARGKCYVYAGLAPFLKLTPEMLSEQIEKCRQFSDGVIFFATHHLSDDLLRLLKIGPFRNKAVPPHSLRK
jgi:uncharacterized lipoprotein YddW (UPF0748 family)